MRTVSGVAMGGPPWYGIRLAMSKVCVRHKEMGGGM